jgi:hypothetical protein
MVFRPRAEWFILNFFRVCDGSSRTPNSSSRILVLLCRLVRDCGFAVVRRSCWSPSRFWCLSPCRLTKSKAAGLCSWVRGDWIGFKDSVHLFLSLVHMYKGIYLGWIFNKLSLVCTYYKIGPPLGLVPISVSEDKLGCLFAKADNTMKKKRKECLK